MIIFKYTKNDGAEYLSHLDLLRHVSRTLRRAGIQVAKSEGYHAHPRIFLNNPLAVGVKSVAEYGAADAPYTPEFKRLFNANSPKGITCLDCKESKFNPNYADCIEKSGYKIIGVNPFDTRLITDEEHIVITDLRGREVDIRPRVFTLEFTAEGLDCTLGCGNNNLRPDLFASYLCGRFGGTVKSIEKYVAYGKEVF